MSNKLREITLKRVWPEMAVCIKCGTLGTCFLKQDMTGDKNGILIISKVGGKKLAKRVPLEFNA